MPLANSDSIHDFFIEENRRFVEFISYIRYMFIFLPVYIDI